MLLGSALLMAEPREGEKSVEDLARQLREALQNDAGAFADMVERAREGGGRLELDMEEFEELLGRGREDGAPMSPDMAEFLREMHSGGDSRVLSKEEALKLLGRDWMDRLGKQQEPAKETGSSSDAIKNFMRMLGRQMQGRSSGANEREHRSILEEYRPVIETARKSTVALLSGRSQVALGTVVDPAGFVLTKASEVVGRSKLRGLLPGGAMVSAELVDVYEPLDLALVRIAAEGLVAADWAGDEPVEIGSFLAVPGTDEDPIAIGVASVASRNISEKTKGFLGVTPEGSGGEVRLVRVLEGMPAEKAGLAVGDIVVAIDGNLVTNRSEFHRMIGDRQPGEELEFKVRRGDEEKLLIAKLVSREALVELNGGALRVNPRFQRMNEMGGELSDNRSGYTAALQTDLTLEPSECGGPVVNLDGKVVGINIARGGRVKSYAVPVDKLRPLLGDVKSGKFTITDLVELRSLVEVADAALKEAEAALEAAREAKRAADQALEKQSAKE
jgi:serine protease Do